MMRSLFAAVSGLKNHQTRQDVIGNNIANVNTVGFKASRVNFQDILSQTLQGSSSAQGNRGGTNPKQVGLGVGLASIDTLFTDGSYQPTGKQTDLAIQGQGFFVLSDGANKYYTRAGNFDFDEAGNYLAGNGMKVVGWMADDNGVINTSGTTSTIQVPVGSTMAAKATTAFEYANNLSADAKIGTIAPAQMEVFDSLGNSHIVNQTFVKVADNKWISTSNVTNGTITGGSLYEISFDSWGKVQSPVAVTPSATSIADTTVTASCLVDKLKLDNTLAGTTSIPVTVYDSTGTSHTLTMKFENTQAYAAGTSDGKWTYTLEEGGLPVTGVTGTVTFPANGSTYQGFPSSIPLNGGQVSLNVTNQQAPGAAVAGDNTVSPTDKSYPTKQATVPALQLDNTKGSVHSENYTVFDSKGVPHVFQVEITNTAPNVVGPPAVDGKWSYKVTELGKNSTTAISSGVITYDNAGSKYTGFPAIPYNDGEVSSLLNFSITTPTAPAASTFVAASSAYTTGLVAGPLTITPGNGAQAMSITVNYNKLTQYGGESTIQPINNDGYPAGTLDLAKLTIDQSGIITAGFTNGKSKSLGQVAMAVFNNTNGLTKAGDNLFAKSNNSGDAQIGAGGAGGRGSFSAGILEMSNVDIAQQFTDMITTQRGFQANSKVITTDDEILETLANLKR